MNNDIIPEPNEDKNKNRSCKDCKVGRGYHPFLDYVELCPLHAAAPALIEALGAFINKLDIRSRWPCGECGRVNLREPLKSLKVEREDGSTFFGGCWLCNTALICRLGRDALALANSQPTSATGENNVTKER